jgi:photosystem II stability/assembly factor-like uncharacterized protein
MRRIPWTLLLSVLLWLACTEVAHGGRNGRNVWTAIGPDGGFVTAVAVDPRHPATLYAGTSNGGLFKTTNGGRSWTSVHLGLGDFAVNALAIDPVNPKIVYAGTDAGIFKSTNGGESWSAASSGLPQGLPPVAALVIDPITPSTLYAGVFLITGGGGLFKSVNGGASWAAVNAGLTDLFVSALAVDPKTPTTLYAGTSDFLFGGGGVFKSTNGGASWRPINTGLTNILLNDLAIDPGNPAIVYAATDGGMFKSRNGGASWSAIGVGLPTPAAFHVRIDPVTPTNLYASTDRGVFRSANGGASWVAANADLPSSVFALAIDPARPRILYAGAVTSTQSEGMFKSTDGGRSWSAINEGLTGLRVNVIAVDPSAPKTLYTAPNNFAGVFKTVDDGRSWIPANDGLEARFVSAIQIDQLTPSTLYAATASGLFKSTDAATSWTALRSDVLQDPVEIVAIDPVTTSTLYGATSNGRVFKSVDGGTSWTEGPRFDGAVEALAIDPASPNTLYAAVELGPETGSRVFKSENGGASWGLTSVGLPAGTSIAALVVDPVTSTTVYAAIGFPGFFEDGVRRRGGVFKSTDGGLSWRSASAGLPNDIVVNALAIDPVASATLYAGTAPASLGAPADFRDGGVFVSGDGGASWTAFNAGLTDNTVLALAISPAAPGKLYAGTETGSLFTVNRSRSCIGTGRFHLRGVVITVPDRAELPNVTITVTGPGGCHDTIVTSADGHFVLHGLTRGRYVVTAEKVGCTFRPFSHIVKVRSAELGARLRGSCHEHTRDHDRRGHRWDAKRSDED